MIEVQLDSKSYGKKEVLSSFQFKLEAGLISGIVGKNGAGKTTLFKCLCCLENFEGTINSPYELLKDHIGYVPTSPFFLSRMTGLEYLTLVLNARKLPTVAIADKNIFDLPLHEYASNYSTGMKKKLALLGALLQNNDIFILDEPFNGVDLAGNMLIAAIIRELKSKGKTILLSSHIFASLSELTDSIYVLDEGKLSPPVQPSEFQALEAELTPSIKDGILTNLIP